MLTDRYLFKYHPTVYSGVKSTAPLTPWLDEIVN
jgi:hypothetical protein